MSILKLHYYPDSLLRKVSEKVDIKELTEKEFRTYLNDLAETMYEQNGIGLASPQVGVLKRAIAVDVSKNGNSLKLYINPEIISSDEIVTSEEGCLSIPEYRDTIPRFRRIKVKALNENGEMIEREAEDLEAFCLQHEIDHLNGVLFIDKLSRLKREMFKRWHKKNQPE